MGPNDPTFNSPKRKRNQQAESPSKSSPIRVTTPISSVIQADEDSAAESPRTKVAHRFEGLQLDGSGVGKFDLPEAFSQLDGSADPEEMANKRMRLVDGEMEIPETPQQLDPTYSLDASELDPAKTNPIIFKGLTAAKSSSAILKKSYPSINRLADSKSRGRKRMSTPPLGSSAKISTLENDDGIVDVDRANLTWHDDEITGHNPNDPDDDGEGINGVGFRPTAAQAAARSQRRKQQLAEYRSRESKEARAKRNERRRGSVTLPRSTIREEVEAARRVRFSGSDGDSMFII